MDFGWQDALVTGAALAAGAWLLVDRRRRRRAGGCDGCPATPAAPAADRIVPASSIRRLGGRRDEPRT